MIDTSGIGKINIDEPEKRFQSLEACFDYTLKKLSDKIKNMLYCLTLFKSPFPISVAKDIFNDEIKSITELYNRSLVLQIKSETSFGEIGNPKFWLYSIHPAIRNYLEKTIDKAIGKSNHDLKKEHGANFYAYYYDILLKIYNSIGKENRRDSLAQFNIISQGKDNDFERSIIFLRDKKDKEYEQTSAHILRYLGGISKDIGLYTKAEEYFKKSIDIYNKIGNIVGLTRAYRNIGRVYYNMGEYEQALEYYNKAVEIDTDLNNRVRMAKDYHSLNFPLYRMNKKEEALDYLSIAKTILLDFHKETGYSHPLLKDVEDRISSLNQDKE